jgi:alpha-L-fucosidase
MTMANSWSYVPNDQYKSTATLLKNLCLIVSRGGNFLLNIAPDPQGRFDNTAYQRLEEIGTWMKVNGEAIYGSKPVAPYEVKDANNGSWVFTQVEKAIYAIWIPGENNQNQITLDLSLLKMNGNSKNKWKVKALNAANKATVKNGILTVQTPQNSQDLPQVLLIQ